ncbi:MAG: prepilin-type N-terminal cleavage/methylation domain-containing protein [Candidatus Euphemobacter frigidus]|nr:prepilin-type N-terminal cleavage/methylation domain-containing protein [Candidatus Euphemobacter frigidus]MDP8276706.1 prepilin-type N-terminal cleavage/methylation domain-containing protein [Candidatus Euphemobacter frigidus]
MIGRRAGRVLAQERNGGFTIIEILIAITLGAVVLASVYGAYYTVMKTTRNYSRVSDIYQTARIVLDTMAKEISGAYQPLFAEQGTKFLGKDEWYGGFENDTLNMVTTTCLRGEEDEIGYDSFEVSYYLGHGRQDGLLFMKTAPYFILEAEELFQEGEEIILAENVRALDFKYFDAEGEWVEAWEVEEENVAEESEAPALPYGVRITISMGLEGEKETTRFSTVASLPMIPRMEEDEEEMEE